MVPDRLFLVGFLGAPKLEVGRELVRRLRRPLFDIEEAVEAAAKMSLGEILRKEGEGELRQRERRALVTVATGPPAVIVTGAGTFVDRGIERGVLISKATEFQGLESAPTAFVELLAGRTVGTTIVRVGLNAAPLICALPGGAPYPWLAGKPVGAPRTSGHSHRAVAEHGDRPSMSV